MRRTALATSGFSLFTAAGLTRLSADSTESERSPAIRSATILWISGVSLQSFSNCSWLSPALADLSFSLTSTGRRSAIRLSNSMDRVNLPINLAKSRWVPGRVAPGETLRSRSRVAAARRWHLRVR